MCKKAKEMQKLCKYRMGDWFLFPKGLWVLNGDIDGKFLYPWLPTQEQLFEMHSKWYRKRYKGKMMISEYFLYLNEFAVIAEESKYKYYSPVEMMMGYLYQEKYSKEWTGEKWVKAE